MAHARAILLGFILLACGLAKSVHAAPPADAGVDPADRDKVLGVGDIVTLEIVEDKEAPVSKKVTDTGDLDVPYIRRVHVAGKTCSQVAAEITRLLEADYYHKATVKLNIEQINRVKFGTAGKVYLSGDVKVPGAQEIPVGETMNVSAAIVRAGGATQFGDLKKVKLTRKGAGGASETIIVNVKAVLEDGKLEQDRELRDGDNIFVPRRLFTI
jgi:protein involved in polysaccharide export with SLBB domain